ncbi:MAG: hypothetical protein ACRC3J_05125 [Culicoidibacterales bacterium]
MIKRHPNFGEKAFTGPYYIVNTKSNLAIQSERTEEKAIRDCNILNQDSKDKNRKYHTEIFTYEVIKGDW